MAPDSGAASLTPSYMTGVRDKVRLRFRKDGPLRWLSHHDLMRTFERMLRRAALPFRCTQGFNPHPRLVFALSLPVGVIGCEEVADLELDELLPLEEIRTRLQAQCPSGLKILDLQRVSPKASLQVEQFTYAIEVPAALHETTRQRLDEVLALSEWLVERSKPSWRRVDLRPFIGQLVLDDTTGWLEMNLLLTSQGTARPDEILRLVGLDRLLDEGGVLERRRLVLKSETD